MKISKSTVFSLLFGLAIVASVLLATGCTKREVDTSGHPVKTA